MTFRFQACLTTGQHFKTFHSSCLETYDTVCLMLSLSLSCVYGLFDKLYRLYFSTNNSHMVSDPVNEVKRDD
jgi:hypothetical protein